MLELRGLVWLTIPAALIIGRPASVAALLGVAPRDEGKYSGTSFRCFNGEGDTLPSGAVNDEFCDCVDGSDEPGTGACAGQETTHFYCPNEGSTPRKLYASRVGDGICDCCDGSDEAALETRAARSGVKAGCKNTCAEQGLIEREAMALRIKELQQAVVKSEEIKAKALNDRGAFKSDLAKLESELPALEEAQTVVTKAADAEREARKEQDEIEKKKKEEEEKAKAAKAEEETKKEEERMKATWGGECKWRQTGGCSPKGVRESDRDKSCSDMIGAGASGYCDCDGDERQGPKEPGYECKGSRPQTCTKACLAAVEGTGDEQPQVSEYAKWMDGASDALGGEGEEAPAAAADSGEEKPQVSEYAKWMDGAAEKMAEKDDGAAAKKAREVEGEAAASAAEMEKKKTAIDLEREAKRKVSDHKDKIQKLKGNIDALPDDKLAYASLIGKTLERKVGEFKYKISFFSDAKQDSVSLGKWSKWTGPSSAEFDKGTMCWGGPERKLLVQFECGLEEKLLDASEPSRCVYEATVSHPGACDPKELEELSTGTRVVGVREEL